VPLLVMPHGACRLQMSSGRCRLQLHLAHTSAATSFLILLLLLLLLLLFCDCLQPQPRLQLCSNSQRRGRQLATAVPTQWQRGGARNAHAG
jgi:hypothetical protein